MSGTGPPPDGPFDSDEEPAGDAVPGAGRRQRRVEDVDWDLSDRWRLRDHAGVVSGIVLGLIALAVLVLVAAAGDPGAFGILVVIVIGIALIYFGGQLHGSRSRR
jgi:hypothetical protein